LEEPDALPAECIGDASPADGDICHFASIDGNVTACFATMEAACECIACPLVACLVSKPKLTVPCGKLDKAKKDGGGVDAGEEAGCTDEKPHRHVYCEDVVADASFD
jgi:hypothetical protein